MSTVLYAILGNLSKQDCDEDGNGDVMCSKQIDASLLCVCPLIDDKLMSRHCQSVVDLLAEAVFL